MNKCRYTDIKREKVLLLPYIHFSVSQFGKHRQIALVRENDQWTLSPMFHIWCVRDTFVSAWHVCLTLLWRQWAADFMLDCTNVLWHGASSVVPKGWEKNRPTVHVWWAGLSVCLRTTSTQISSKVIHVLLLRSLPTKTFSFPISSHPLSQQGHLSLSLLAHFADGILFGSFSEWLGLFWAASYSFQNLCGDIKMCV